MAFPEYDSLDATGLAALIARGEISPTEALEAALERADARNPPINAIVARFDDSARRSAAGPLADGPFRGVPFLLKDFLAQRRGWPITASSRFLQSVVAPEDSELVHRFDRAGLVLFGQTNTPELAIHGVTESRLRGPCRNPWNPAHTSGGSSGGAGAAVAARIVPMAHGNDGGGSLRIPASACGVFALKPTRGRISLAPQGEALGGFVQEGVVSISVRDTARMLDAIAGPVPGDPYAAPPPARPFAEEVGAPQERLRIALEPRALFAAETHADCVAAAEDAGRLLESLGHEVVLARPGIDRDRLAHAYLVILAASVRSDLDRAAARLGRALDPASLEPETWALALAGRKLPADAYVSALADIHDAAREVARFLADFDLLLGPTMARPPVRVGELALRRSERVALEAVFRAPVRRAIDALLRQIAARSFEATGNTMLFNQTGQPAVSVPLAWNGAGLPIGVQLAARFGDEATLLRVASQLEQARPWAARRPPGI